MESESLEELRGKGSSTGAADEEEDKLDVEADLSSSLLSIVMVEHGDDRAIPLECDDGSIAAMDTAHCNTAAAVDPSELTACCLIHRCHRVTLMISALMVTWAFRGRVQAGLR